MFHQGAGAQGTATVATGFTHKGPLGQGHCLFSPQRASTGTEVGVTQLEAGGIVPARSRREGPSDPILRGWA